MTNVEEKVQQVIEQLSEEELQKTLQNLTMAMMSGKTPEYASCFIKFTMPKDIFDLIAKACKPLDINPEEVISQMASDSFNKEIKAITSYLTSLEEDDEEETPPLKAGDVQFNIPKVEGMPDVSKLMAGLNQIQQLAGQLEELQKVLDATESSATRKDNKHTP